ncbi:unnamed protein product [Lactuca saligna]|uniref:Uncharacterized protein n=1 Tax=Lactuca saligna TaxID=75948 RepID=A0AA35YW89_LACSI|nr:unnamed protein product [Lactuca saligna]
MEEDRSSRIIENLSNKDLNVNMGENPSTSAPDSSSVLPTPSSIQPNSIIPPTKFPFNSPTFEGIMTQPIDALLSSQSTDQDMTNNEEDETIKFYELEFDPKEEDVEDHTIMSGKQYIFLYSNLIIIIQFMNDSSGFTASSISK